jgi:hypothetical protein
MQATQVERLLLTPQDRERIDAERLKYLKSLQVKEVVEEEKEPEVVKKPEPKTPAKSYHNVKKPVVLPKQLSVSAVIEKPDGSRLIRINNQFTEQPAKHVSVDTQKSNIKGAELKVDEKPVFVPVGTTYLPAKNRLIDTYVIEQKAVQKTDPKQKILKADETAVKRTLKDVEIVNQPPTTPP